MNIIKNVFVMLLLVNIESFTQYVVKCPYLINPELTKGYVDSCARFWFSSFDDEYGGFYENVERDGTPSGTSKTMLGNSRTAYGMVRAFMLSGDTTYLNYARRALDFNYSHAWDRVYSGWFNELDREGNVLPSGQRNNDKWSFMQHYALLGITAMVEATQNEIDREYMISGREAIDDNLWDSRPGYEGYFNEAALDWSEPLGKGFTPTMDGITTNILSMFLVTGEDTYRQRLLDVADNVIDHMLPSMELFDYGYPEEYNNDWEPTSNTYVFTGHFLKSAWCLTRAYLVEPKQEYLDFSSIMLDEVYEKGYDHTYGGCYKEYDGLTGTAYGDDKEWWELEQAFNAGVMNYYISKNDTYLRMADESLDFFMKYFVDRENGEVYATTNRKGTPLTFQKASYWKAGYHSIELGYYAYLYGNLFLHQRPVSLFYYFNPQDTAREIKLYPLAIEDENLVITSVRLNGNDYENYTSAERQLSIPSGSGGKFEVTFENIKSNSLASDEVPMEFELKQNYPNPFNPSTSIQYNINTDGMVNLEVYDLLGQRLNVLVNEYKKAGDHKSFWNGRNNNGQEVSSGIYFFHLKFANRLLVKKGILLK